MLNIQTTAAIRVVKGGAACCHGGNSMVGVNSASHPSAYS
jgi:hypothetical protein